MSYFVFFCWLFIINLLLFTCNYVVSVRVGFSTSSGSFGMGYLILLWHSMSLPYNYFKLIQVFL